MKTILFIALAGSLLTGCSELRIIGTAAMNELQCTDITNAEIAAYRQPDMAEEVVKEEKPIVVAKANIPQQRPRDYKKGAWEHF